MLQTTMNRKGFTLEDLLLALAVIGILGTVAVIQFNQYRNHIHRNAIISELKDSNTALKADD